MASAAWFERLDRPTARVLSAGQKCLDGLRATSAVGEDDDGNLIHRAHVPWPSLHESLTASLAQAQRRAAIVKPE